jgi:putative holliday junction resolvase
MIAGGIDTIINTGNVTKCVQDITKIVSDYSVKKVVIGFPKNMNNSEGFRAEATNKFIESLKSSIDGIEIIKWDERLTTVQASRAMNDMGMKRKNKKGNVDKLSAVIILQGYLDLQSNMNNGLG